MLLVAPVWRALNDKSIHELMPLPLRAELAEYGRLGDVAIIATRADEVARAELAHNLGLPVDTPAVELVAKRREFIQREMVDGWFRGVAARHRPVNRGIAALGGAAHDGDGHSSGDGLQAVLPSASGEDGASGAHEAFDLAVFVASSTEFQAMTGVAEHERTGLFANVDETDIPSLAALIRRRAHMTQLRLRASEYTIAAGASLPEEKTGARLLRHLKATDAEAATTDGAPAAEPSAQPSPRPAGDHSPHLPLVERAAPVEAAGGAPAAISPVRSGMLDMVEALAKDIEREPASVAPEQPVQQQRTPSGAEATRARSDAGGSRAPCAQVRRSPAAAGQLPLRHQQRGQLAQVERTARAFPPTRGPLRPVRPTGTAHQAPGAKEVIDLTDE